MPVRVSLCLSTSTSQFCIRTSYVHIQCVCTCVSIHGMARSLLKQGFFAKATSLVPFYLSFYTCIRVCMYVCIYICICINIYMYVYIYRYMYMYVYLDPYV